MKRLHIRRVNDDDSTFEILAYANDAELMRLTKRAQYRTRDMRYSVMRTLRGVDGNEIVEFTIYWGRET